MRTAASIETSAFISSSEADKLSFPLLIKLQLPTTETETLRVQRRATLHNFSITFLFGRQYISFSTCCWYKMLRKDRDSERNKQAILKSAAKRKSFSGSKLQETATVRTYLYNE